MATQVSLPYVDNLKAIAATVAINLVVLFVFFWPGAVTIGDVAVDSAICAITTTAINLPYVRWRLRRLAAAGGWPATVPQSRTMQWLPSNPWLLGLVLAVGFAVATVAANVAIMRFFGLESMRFWPWLVFKLCYATFLSAKIVQFCVFRFVQSDVVSAEISAPASGLAAVRNPLPKVSVFSAMFGSVTTNIAMNVLIGALLGGVLVVEDNLTVIVPTYRTGIWLTGLIFGAITGALVTRGVVSSVRQAIRTAGPEAAALAQSDRRFSWLPRSLLGLTLATCALLMAVSAALLPATMALFGVDSLTFLQFSVFITVYASLVSRPVAWLLVRRCSQADFVAHTLAT